MRIDVVTLFPEMVEHAARFGVTGRARERGLWRLGLWNPRDFATDNHRTVDDRPYGGGPGMVMIAGPLGQALALRGASVGIDRAALPALAADELYWADLEGLAVVNRDGVPLGTVAEVIDNGAHPILRVRDAAALERLIPWVPVYVDGVDRDARRIDVDWPADY